MPPTLIERQVAHVWRRLGFGPTPGDIVAGTATGPEVVVSDLLARELTTPAEWGFTTATGWQDQETWLAQWLAAVARPDNPAQERVAWILQGLVVAGMDGTAYFQDVRDHVARIRANPFGDYDQLLAELCVMPGLCKYLTNHLNTKAHPNQNLARELLELFTLGLGSYTEKDIQEIARALTGYQLDWSTGKISFSASQHDGGTKTFLGANRGAAKLPETLAAITQQPAWTTFVPRRLWRELVGVDPTPAQLGSLAAAWGSHGDVAATVEAIVTDPAFLDPACFATKVRTPVELVVGAARVLRVDLTSVRIGWELRDLMGQHPLMPPNVAGWPGGTRWFSTSIFLTWSQLVTQLVGRSLQLSAGPIDELHAAGAAGAADEAIRLTCLTEATPGTRAALGDYATAGSWNRDRAAGTLALALLSPEWSVA